MINFYKNNGGVGTIQFESGEIIALSYNVDVRADNTTNLIIISEFNRDKFWISTAKTLQVNGVTITGTNQQKADLISPIFQQTATGTGTGVTSYADLTNKPTIPSTLDQITDTATRLAVSPTEKTTWNGKATSSDISTLTTNKVNVSDVLNALTQTVAGKVLDARQGKALSDLIATNTASIALKADRANPAQITLTDAATVVWDFSLGNRAKVTLGGNRTLTIINASEGDIGILDVYQDATGGRTLAVPGSLEIGKTQGATATFKDKFTFEAIGSSFDWAINNFGPQSTTLTFTGASLVNTSGVWTTTGTSAGYGNTGIVTGLKLPAGGTGRVIMQSVTGATNAVLGVRTTNAAVGWTSFLAGIILNGSNLIFKVEGGVVVNNSVSAAEGGYACIYRAANGVMKIQKSTDKITWTDAYTFTATSTADLFIVCDFYGTGGGATPGKMYYPTAEGVQ